jgi:hypothetical protein
MCLQGFAKKASRNSNGRKAHLLGVQTWPRQVSVWIWDQVSYGPRQKAQEKNQDTRRRSAGADGGENRFLGGSDPTLSGLAAAQRLRRRGSLPPKLSNRLPRSVAGRVVGEAVRKSESRQQQESRIWP